ncbi:MAG: CatB-related O-acetyltransferase [Synergistaceae bacterium]|nr:CatB-related O-acetyltransferase [Synergistaceae bacterium]
MSDGATPDPNRPFPLRSGSEAVTYVKPTVGRPGIVVGEFTYYAGAGFEERVTHHHEWNGDQLIIGKFCQIAAGVEFVMNGANHQMDAVSTFPFYIFEGWEQEAPPPSEMPLKGDTVVGNDVWIGQGATILPGVHIGDGAIIGMKSVVGSDVPPYAIVVGAPARQIRKRFDDDLIELMLRLRWWDRPVEEIQRLIPILTCSDLEKARAEIRALLEDGPGR